MCRRRIKESEEQKLDKKEKKRRERTRVDGQGEGSGVSLLGRWWDVFSFVLVQCVCVCVPTLTSRAGLQHRTCSQLAYRGRATAFVMHRTVKQTGTA